jgi:hypothetical protein
MEQTTLKQLSHSIRSKQSELRWEKKKNRFFVELYFNNTIRWITRSLVMQAELETNLSSALSIGCNQLILKSYNYSLY